MKIRMVAHFSWDGDILVFDDVGNICQKRWSEGNKIGFHYFSGEVLFGEYRLIQKTNQNEACDF